MPWGGGNGERDAEGLARAWSKEGSGVGRRWGWWTGRRGVGGNNLIKCGFMLYGHILCAVVIGAAVLICENL